jgi:hypothetical protein
MSDNYLDRDCDLTLQQALDKYYTPSNAIQYVLNSFNLIEVYFMARKVKPKWDFYNYHAHLDRSLVDIRKEFSIHVS